MRNTMNYWSLIGLACGSLAVVSPASAQLLQNAPRNDQQGQQNGNNNNNNSNNQASDDQAENGDENQRELPERFSTPLSASGPIQSRTGNETRASASDLDRSIRLIPAEPSEFERYVERQLGRPLKRYGSQLLVPETRDFATPPITAVPATYRVSPGDRLLVRSVGSIETSANLDVDNEGMIFIESVGRIQVAGVPYSQLQSVVNAAYATRFRRFSVSVTIARIRGIRVYVSGFASNPGAYTVSGLSTLANAVLAAGGPSGGGSFRTIQLFRRGQLVTTFDLYQLLRGGDRLDDTILQNEDSIVIPAVGEQIAVAGSVNEEAIYEAKPGETIADVISRYAGGPNALADQSRVMLTRVDYLQTTGSRELSSAEAATMPVRGGDIVQLLSVGSIARPLERQAVTVRIEGEVVRPGDYFVPPNTPLSEVIALAGGLTPQAYLFGTKFQRASVREQQRESYRDALDQFEMTLLSNPLTGSEFRDSGAVQIQTQAGQAILEKLRTAEPDGRIILAIDKDMPMLPNQMALENSDRIYIPPRPSTVGVFGSVFSPGSFQYDGRRKGKDLIQLAGGPAREADKGAIFLVRPNGEVISKRRGGLDETLAPGDLVFVPAKSQRSSVWAKIRDISTLIFQLGLGAATVAAIQ